MIRSSRYLSTLLGINRPRLEILGSISFALIVFIYAFTVSSFFDLRTFILLDRITYDFTINQTIISHYIDQLLILIGTFVWLISFLNSVKGKVLICAVYGVSILVALFFPKEFLPLFMTLVSVPMIGTLLLYDNFAPKRLKILRWSSALSLNYLWIIASMFGILSLAFSLALLLPFSIQTSEFLHDFAFEIFLMLAAFSPVFILLLIFCVPLKLALIKLMRRISHRRVLLSQHDCKLTTTHRGADVNDVPVPSINKHTIISISLTDETLSATNNKTIGLKTKIAIVALSMMLSIALASIPHLPVVNSDDSVIGVDTHYYVSWTNNMTIYDNQGPLGTVAKAFVLNGGDRPLSLLIIFYFINLFSSVEEDIAHAIDNNLPLILAPLLVLAIYFMTKQMTSSDLISILAASLTAVSYHILIGIYAGFFANWIGLIIGYVSVGFMFKSLRRSKKLDLAFFFVGMIGLMLTHVYTWTVFVLIISIFLILLLRMKVYPKRVIFILLIIVLTTVVIDVSKSALLGTNLSIQNDLRFLPELETTSNNLVVWDTLVNTVQRFLGGLFANPIILLLGIFWLIRCNYKHPANILLFIFFSTGIASLFISGSDWMIQARLLYFIPIQLPAAIALSLIINQNKYRRNITMMNDQLGREAYLSSLAYNRVIVCVVFIWLISMSIKALANLPPNV